MIDSDLKVGDLVQYNHTVFNIYKPVYIVTEIGETVRLKELTTGFLDEAYIDILQYPQLWKKVNKYKTKLGKILYK
jgi:hypothetical protein